MIAPLAGIAPVSSTGQAVVAGTLLGQAVSQMVESRSEWCVAPAPAAQARASNSRLVQLADMAPPEAAQEGPQSLPSRRRGVDGALTVPPRARAVLRNTSASSMQSPPARQTQPGSSSLSPVLALPGALPRSRRCRTSSGRPRRRARVRQAHWPPGGDHRDTQWRIYWVLRGWFRVSRRGAPLASSDIRD